MLNIVKSFRRMALVPFVLLPFFVGACAPVGYGDVGFTYVNWPKQDIQLPPEALVEVESHLFRLGYLASQPDGAITVGTRGAIRDFQTDIGAPANGFLSPTLLTALRVNSGLGAAIISAPAVGPGGVTPVTNSGGGRGGRGGGGGRGGDGGAGGWL